jgi:hypothetical protein
LLGQPPGLPHRRQDRARGEPGDEDARACSGGQGSEPEQPGEADTQVKRPPPVLGFPSQRMHPVGAPQPTQREERRAAHDQNQPGAGQHVAQTTGGQHQRDGEQ